MTKNAYFGPNLAGFGPKILILIQVSESFGIQLPINLFHSKMHYKPFVYNKAHILYIFYDTLCFG